MVVPYRMKLKQILSNNLKAFRKERDWTQEVLAEKSGVSRDAIARYEAMKNYPWIPTLKKLADGLGIAPYLLLKDFSEAEPDAMKALDEAAEAIQRYKRMYQHQEEKKEPTSEKKS